MNRAITTPGGPGAPGVTLGFADHSPGSSGPGPGVKLQARFWRSPFAVAAAAVLVAQSLLLAVAALRGATVSYEVTTALTAVSATLLAAGIWPNWNYLLIEPAGLDQQAGLRSVRVAWCEVQNVRIFDGWAELRISRGGAPGASIRRVAIFNRYALSADAFADLLEGAWIRSRAVQAAG